MVVRLKNKAAEVRVRVISYFLGGESQSCRTFLTVGSSNAFMFGIYSLDKSACVMTMLKSKPISEC